MYNYKHANEKRKNTQKTGEMVMKVSVIGATGYAGAELLRILLEHPEAEIAHITSESHTGKRITEMYPHLEKGCALSLESMEGIEAIAADSDVVFIGLPHGHAMAVGKALEKTSAKLIDLGADYRFKDTDVYEKWYKTEHTHKDAARVYGLAELYRDQIRTARIIGNAGCYTTASILALAPLAKCGLIDLQTIVVDAKSGISGAGRAAKMENLFAEMYDNLKAYGVAGHRHTPEIEQALTDLGKETVTLTFTPHLIPMSRGILSTCYANLRPSVTAEQVDEAFAGLYGGEYFIRLRGRGACPATKHTRGTNFCDIGWHIDARTGKVIVLSAIDNLVKGAAGQAVQNMNIACGLDETAGLTAAPLYP